MSITEPLVLLIFRLCCPVSLKYGPMRVHVCFCSKKKPLIEILLIFFVYFYLEILYKYMHTNSQLHMVKYIRSLKPNSFM